MTRWLCHGEPINEVPIGDRALHYGDGLFETIAMRNGEPRLWEFHLERLERGCQKLGFVKPVRGLLRSWLDAACLSQDAVPRKATAKILLTAGLSERGYARSMPTSPTIYVGMTDAAPVAVKHYHDGVQTIVSEIRLAVPSVTAGCKTLNRIEQVLARSECVAKGVFEGLTLDAEGRLICGTMSNVFIVSDNSIATPSLGRCGVEGVMRRLVIEMLRRRGQAVAIRDISEAELMCADEVFLSNSQFGVIPVRQCGDQAFATQAVTRSIMGQLAEKGIEECGQ